MRRLPKVAFEYEKRRDLANEPGDSSGHEQSGTRPAVVFPMSSRTL